MLGEAKNLNFFGKNLHEHCAFEYWENISELKKLR